MQQRHLRDKPKPAATKSNKAKRRAKLWLLFWAGCLALLFGAFVYV